MDQDADSFPRWRKAARQPRYSSSYLVLRSLRTPPTLRSNMHQNQEICSAPWSGDLGRSAKAMNRTADMQMPEKSDCAVDSEPVEQKSATFREG